LSEPVILLVEDSEDDVELTVRALRRNGIQSRVDVARDGAAAVEYLLGESAGPLPTVVLLDLNLPKLTGLEVLERLRASPRTRLVPVVILTSSREQKDLLEGYALGANSYVRKPVDYDAFLEAARQLGVYWLQVNEPPPAPAGG
jgi:two-component system, response regulator